MNSEVSETELYTGSGQEPSLPLQAPDPVQPPHGRSTSPTFPNPSGPYRAISWLWPAWALGTDSLEGLSRRERLSCVALRWGHFLLHTQLVLLFLCRALPSQGQILGGLGLMNSADSLRPHPTTRATSLFIARSHDYHVSVKVNCFLKDDN